MYPQEYIYLSEGVHLGLAIEEKIYLQKIYFGFFTNICTYISEYYIKIICLLLNVSMTYHDEIFCHKKF